MCDILLERFEDKNERVKICYNHRDIRAVVMCKALNLHSTHNIPFSDAVSEAWDWVRKQCKEVDIYI